MHLDRSTQPTLITCNPFTAKILYMKGDSRVSSDDIKRLFVCILHHFIPLCPWKMTKVRIHMMYKTYEDLCTRGRHQGKRKVITPHSYCGVITCPCLWYLPPAQESPCTVYPKKHAHGFVVLCFVVVMQSFIMNSHEVFIHIHQGCFAGTGAIVRLPQCQWSKPDGYGKISQCITTTKHSKAKTVCIFLGIYCI